VNAAVPAAILSGFANLPARVRAHVSIRWRTCPFPAIAARVPLRGRVLDYGCGHGAFALWLAQLSPERDVLGVDISADRIATAQAAASAIPPAAGKPRFARIEPGEVPPGPWDAILFVDVLYLLPEPEQGRLLQSAAAALAPGGVLLVKEVADRPRVKALWNRLQETLAVRVFRITPGERLRFLAPKRHEEWLSAAGLEVSGEPLDRGYAHPHHLLTARRAQDRP